MGSISVDQFLSHPDTLLSDALAGEINVVTRDGEPVFMALPLGANFDSQSIRMEIAVALFDGDQVSIGVASRIAGLTVSEMIDELGRRKISAVRYYGDEFAEEMKYVRNLVGRR